MLCAECYEDDILRAVLSVPEEARDDFMEYLTRGAERFPLELLARIFLRHWRIGVNLNDHYTCDLEERFRYRRRTLSQKTS